MSPLEPSWERRPLRAPREDGTMLAVPPLSEMPAVIAKNREHIATWDVSVLGKPLGEFRRLARTEVLAALGRFTHQPNAPLVVSGHQPELFHPGVWAKNFVLDHLAKATGGLGLHLIVDNDAVSSTRIAVPVGSREAPHIESIPFDDDAGSIPWEEAYLQNETLFRSFTDRVSAALACWPIKPILSEIWPAAMERLPPVGHVSNVPLPRLCDLLTAVRREAERRLGLNNLELSISQLCETESFAWFVCSLLSDPQRTHAIYNEVVAEYRRVHRVRNRQHPVPDLSTRAGDSDGDWLESPFWIWRPGDLRRGRLFVRTTASELQLANGELVVATLPRPAANSAESTVAQLRALSSLGWKLRPRALTNTLFARVFLADAFLHGIGGAKYDEMTDRLIVRLFGVTPPAFLTVTSTHHLPLVGWDVTSAEVAACEHRLWDFDHNPERFAHEPASPECSILLAEKQRLIAEQHVQDSLDRHDPHRASRAANNQRRRRLRVVSQDLAALASTTRETLAAQRQTASAQLAATAILRSREFSIGLFPSDHFRSLSAVTSSLLDSQRLGRATQSTP